MTTPAHVPGPVVVGGVGGSGTRVVAAMLLRAGLYLGEHLNDELDNLWFTLLFKRPRWRRRLLEAGTSGSFLRHLDVLARASTGAPLRPDDIDLVARAAADMALHGHYEGMPAGEPFRYAATLVDAEGASSDRHRRWGWKEPNSHIYLAELAAHFPNLRYLHLIRHGLDMAYSANQAQARNWAHEFELEPPSGPVDPVHSLRYWIAANRRACEQGRALLGERFTLIRYEDLCHRPSETAAVVLAGAGLEPEPRLVDDIATLPAPPRGAPRYEEFDFAAHGAAALEAVRQFGFEVPDVEASS